MSRDKRLGHRGGFHKIDCGRYDHGHPFVGQNEFGLTSAGHDPEDAVPRFERADDVRPDFVDLTGVFQAEDIRRCAGRRGYIPRACSRSARFKPQARTLTRTWSPRGSGWGTSPIFRTSGPPVPVITTAFMAYSLDGLIEVSQGLNQESVRRRGTGTIRMNADHGQIGCAGFAQWAPSLREWCPGMELPELNPVQIRVWLVDLDSGLGPDDVEVAEPGPDSLGVLTDDERARSARFVRARDRRRFARCRAALRQILGGLLRESPPSLRFRTTGHGKPELDLESMGMEGGDVRAAVRFNVSHSSHLALIGVCRGRELGVDIERIKPLAEADRIVASFFSPTECAEFTAIPEHLKPLAFFRGWTRKEAVLKGFGSGLAGLSAHYETGFGTAELPAYFIPAAPPPGIQEWQLWEAAPRAGFVATVAIHVATTSDLSEPA